MEMTHFAAIGSDLVAVYGVGETAEAAVADARRQAGQYDGPDADLRAVRMSRAAYDYVMEVGGAPSRELVIAGEYVTLASEQ